MNDRPDLAVKLDCDGVHVGQDDMPYAEARRIVGPDRQIGVTCKASRDLAMTAGEAGADYVAFGAFFPSSTKTVTTPASLEIIEWWSELFEIPCVAIGGITVEIDAWRVDIAYSGTQKCLGVPPGLAPITVSDRARARFVERSRSWYLDLAMIGDYVGPARRYHHTAPVSMVYALHAGLGVLLGAAVLAMPTVLGAGAPAGPVRVAALLLAGRTREAIGVLREALEIDSKRADALNNLGVAYLAMGRTKSAAVNLERAAKHRESPRILLNLGKVMEDAHEPAEAVRAYDQVLKLRPKDSEAVAGSKRLGVPTKSRRRPRKKTPKTPKEVARTVRRKTAPATEEPPS